MERESGMGSRKIIRPLGYNEQYELAQYTLSYHRGVSTACRFAIPQEIHHSSHGCFKNIVYGAIARVVSESPMLQAAIEDAESKKPLWVHIDSIDLGKHVQWVELDHLEDRDMVLQEKIRSELDTKYAELAVRPGWRVVVFQYAGTDELDVIFTWNHAYTDGMGGKIFHERLLSALIAETQSEGTDQTVDDLKLKIPDTPLKFPPSTELFVDLPMSPTFLLQQAWHETRPTSIFPKSSVAKWAPIRTTSYKTKFRTCSVDNATLAGILTACRSHKTTLTALLHSLVLLSLTCQLDENAAPAFASLTAIDQRRFLPSHPPKYPWLEPTATMANYVTSITHEFDSAFVSQMRARFGRKLEGGPLSGTVLDLVWSASVEVRADIEGRLQKGLKNDRLGLMRFVSNARALFEKEARKPRALSWGISNLGVMEGTSNREGLFHAGERTWEIRRAQFTLSAHIPDAALLVDVVSLKGGDMVITCTWQDTVIEDILAERVVGDLKRWLDQVGGPVNSKV